MMLHNIMRFLIDHCYYTPVVLALLIFLFAFSKILSPFVLFRLKKVFGLE